MTTHTPTPTTTAPTDAAAPPPVDPLPPRSPSPLDDLRVEVDGVVVAFRHVGRQDKPILPVVLLPPGDPPPHAAALLDAHTRKAPLSRDALRRFLDRLDARGELAQPDAAGTDYGSTELRLVSAHHQWRGIRDRARSKEIMTELQGLLRDDDAPAREALVSYLRRLP